MTWCPKCGMAFGVIDEQRQHVKTCNAVPDESMKSMRGELDGDKVIATLNFLLSQHQYRDSLGRTWQPVAIGRDGSITLMRTDVTQKNVTMTAQQVSAMELLK